MNPNRLTLAVLLAWMALLAACGSPGIPLPPSLELAKPVTDLRAVRKGNKVFLTWTAPTQTTDGHNFRHVGETHLCRTIGSPMTECHTAVARLAPERAPVAKNSGTKPLVSSTDDLASVITTANATANATYAVDVLNSYGRSAGLSNKVEVPVAPVLPAPANFRAQLAANGVHLSWTPISSPQIPGLRFASRVYRREQGSAADTIVGEVPVSADAPATLLDTGFEWEKNYNYRATVVTFISTGTADQQQIEGDDTPAVTLAAHDVFPPETPGGLQAVFSGPGQKPFIDLIWTPNMEADLAGYNVYRRERGKEPQKVNSDLVKSPAFRDSQTLAGHEYFYSVSAVDARGNEGGRSQEASESVP